MGEGGALPLGQFRNRRSAWGRFRLEVRWWARALVSRCRSWGWGSTRASESPVGPGWAEAVNIPTPTSTIASQRNCMKGILPAAATAD